MRILITESHLKTLIQEQGWTDPVKAASGPQKCGLTKGENGSYDKECRALDKEAARQDKIDAKQREIRVLTSHKHY